MTYRRDDELHAIRAHVHRLAAEQGSVFRREHLRIWGVGEEALRPMLRRRWWVKMHHGVYADAETVAASAATPTDRHVLLAAAAIMALPLPVFAFGPTAAATQELPVDRRALDRIQLIREPGTDLRAFRRRVTSQTELLAVDVRTRPGITADTEIVAGVPSVRRDLAAISGAAAGSREWAVAALDAVAWQAPDAVARLEELTEEWPRLLGIGTVRAALPLARTGAQTPLESISRVRLVDRGLPEPELQVPIRDRDGLIGIVDMWFDSLHVVGEADGLLKYQDRDDLVAEKRREDRLRATGRGVARWTWDEILHRTAHVEALIRRASPVGFAA